MKNHSEKVVEHRHDLSQSDRSIKNKELSVSRFLEILGVTERNHPETIYIFNSFLHLLQTTFGEEANRKIIGVIKIMIQCHIEQRRPDVGLYINHPILVAKKTIELLDIPDEETVISAILHDTVEDQSMRFLELSGIELEEGDSPEAEALLTIEKIYGKNVAINIKSLSTPYFNIQNQDQVEMPSPNKREQLFRNLYAEHVKESIVIPSVCIIKFADFSFNAFGLDETPHGEQKMRWALKYRPVIDIFIERISDLSNPLNSTKQASMIQELEESRKYIDSYIELNK